MNTLDVFSAFFYVSGFVVGVVLIAISISSREYRGFGLFGLALLSLGIAGFIQPDYPQVSQRLERGVLPALIVYGVALIVSWRWKKK